MLIFISGGVRSGKSSYAEKLAIEYAIKRKVYVATAKISDDEMQKRVNLHQVSRYDKGFITIECQNDLQTIITKLEQSDTVLIECLTTLVANEMFDKHLTVQQVVDKLLLDITQVSKIVSNLIIVSNDVYGDLELSFEVEAYKQALTSISRAIAAKSDLCYEVVYNNLLIRKQVGNV